LRELRIRIDKKISQRTITNIKISIPKMFDVPDKLAYTSCVIPEMIEAKIRRETPFEIPFSVINSPSHMRRTEPTVITKAARSTVGKEVEITCPPNK
jgi:hypothetical protein